LTSKTKDDEVECLVRSVIKWRKFISKHRIPCAVALTTALFSIVSGRVLRGVPPPQRTRTTETLEGKGKGR
jgi:hypothetical protein